MASGATDSDDCSVCQGQLVNPRLLPCHHTFCAKCIDHLASHHAPRSFPCPICRKPTSLPPGGASALQANFYIKPKDPKLFCSTHTSAKRKYYCEQCEEAVCSECVCGVHKYHKYQDLNTDVSTEVNRLKMAVEKTTQLLQADRDERQKIQNTTRAIEAAIYHKYEAAVKMATEIRDEALDSLRSFKQNIPRLDSRVTEREIYLKKLTSLQKRLDDAVNTGTPSDVVKVAKEMETGFASKVAVNKLVSTRDERFDYPVHKPSTTEQDLLQMTRSFFGSVTSSTQSTPEVTVVDKFNCGDYPNTTVFRINHVDADPPYVWVSYEQYAERQDAPQKMFREGGTFLMDSSRVGKVSNKRYAKGQSMGTTPLTGGLKTFNKYLQSENYSLDNYSSGEAELVKVTVTSINPYKAKDKLEFTINVGPHRAHDVDPTQNVLIVVEEATPPSTCRKVLMYRRPGGDPVTTYTPPTPIFQPSDVSFYTLGGQQVLLVSDQANHAIHVVSVGEDSLTFQRFLTRDCPLLMCPTAINVDVEGRLWVACKGGRVLTMQPIEVSSPCSQ